MTLLRNPRLLLTLLVIGGIGGALSDQIHVRFDVLWYPRPFFLDQAWWVAPLFGGATIGIFLGALPFAQRLVRGDGLTSARGLTLSGASFLAAYLASGAFRAWPIALLAGYAAAWSLRALETKMGGAGLAFSVLLALGGTLFESALSSTGAFYYRAPDFLGVPYWLPGLYLLGAPLALGLALRFGGLSNPG